MSLTEFSYWAIL